ncbi:MAG: glycosyltransferase [Planctomycetota bacterium]
MARSPCLLSVVTPVKDGERTIGRCLESVARLADAFPGQVEHIVKDGGSRDGTLDILRAWATGHGSSPRTLIVGTDRGQSDAINIAADHACGRWFCWLNADDRYTADARRVIEQLKSTDAEVLVGRCTFVDMSGRVVFRPVPPELLTADSLCRPLSKWFHGQCLVQPEVFVHLDAYQAAGGLDPENHFAMDHALWLRLLADGRRTRSVPIHVAEQLAHPEQKTADNLAVARQIHANCTRFEAERGNLSPEAVGEIAQLGTRVREAESVLATGSRPPELRVAPMARAVEGCQASVPRTTGPCLAIGRGVGEIIGATRASNTWARAAEIPRVRDAFAGILVDGRSLRPSEDLIWRLAASVRPGGTVLWAFAAHRTAISEEIEAVATLVRDRVTAACAPTGSHDVLSPFRRVMASLRWLQERAIDAPRIVSRGGLTAEVRWQPVAGVLYGHRLLLAENRPMLGVLTIVRESV